MEKWLSIKPLLTSLLPGAPEPDSAEFAVRRSCHVTDLLLTGAPAALLRAVALCLTAQARCSVHAQVPRSDPTGTLSSRVSPASGVSRVHECVSTASHTDCDLSAVCSAQR